MTEEKHLDPIVAEKIGTFVQQKGSTNLLTALKADAELTSNSSAKQGLEEMSLLFTYLKSFSVLPFISFDLSLARGLDYYTGVIFEVVTEGSAPPQTTNTKAKSSHHDKKSLKTGTDFDEDRSSDPSVGVGSIAAGGRYDNLVGMFSGKAQIPCVGISFGVDRIFSLTKSRELSTLDSVRPTETDVYVMAMGGAGFTGMLPERMETARILWDAGIKAEFSYKEKPKYQQQFKAADQGGVPFAVILGEEEQAQGKVKIKELGLPEGHPEKDGVLVQLTELARELRERIKRKEGGLQDVADAVDGLAIVKD